MVCTRLMLDRRFVILQSHGPTSRSKDRIYWRWPIQVSIVIPGPYAFSIEPRSELVCL
jgi:hypothetical protein